MTESEFLTTECPVSLLDSIIDQASYRKLLLYGIQCCRIMRNNKGVFDNRVLIDQLAQMADGADNEGEVTKYANKEWLDRGYLEDPNKWCYDFLYLSTRVGDESLPIEATL